METRIRELRKSKGWTLQKVADLVGTTAQTVQRLETANMTVSMDWLQKFAKVFSVTPSSLIRDDDRNKIPFLGTMSCDGLLKSAASNDSMEISTTAEQPIAVQLKEPVGAYQAGAFLIGNRLEKENMKCAHGFDSLVSVEKDPVVLSKVLWHGSTVILAPVSRDLPVRIDATPNWVAPIIMEVRYF